ncbi:MAG: DUF402 domain-containing protein [bacterium]|nr:DUF402 domain-containing protein [bacterium]MCM1375925.1 DUF402 domain-containing protein [Muribaculum sp.]
MKKCNLSYEEWKCITAKEMYGKKVHTNFFQGYIGLITIKEVSEVQKWHFNGEDIIVCDKGLQWLSILPQDDFYCITAMMNAAGDILVWYIDMIAEQGICEDGIPYFYDLYLDLVVYPNGEIIEDDRDELEEALRQQDISQEQFNLAVHTAAALKMGLLQDIDSFVRFTQKCYESIR